jgi:glutamate racemase
LVGPEFVPIIEANFALMNLTLHQAARDYLESLLEQQIDTPVYGCTHYSAPCSSVEIAAAPVGAAYRPELCMLVAGASQELDSLAKQSRRPDPLSFRSAAQSPTVYQNFSTMVIRLHSRSAGELAT